MGSRLHIRQLVFVDLDSPTWQELHDYSNRDKWRMVIGIMDYGVWGMGYEKIEIERLETRGDWRFQLL